MPGNQLDAATVDRLLRGLVAPEDAPPGYGEVAALLRRAGTAGEAVAPPGGDHLVAAMAAAVRSAPGFSPRTMRRKGSTMLGRLLTLKALGIAIPAMALTASTAAAATGNLPNPAQDAMHNLLSHVGVSVPAPDSTTTSIASHAVGPNPSGPAHHGLCTAYRAEAGHASSKSVAFANLQKAATQAGQTVAQFCASTLSNSGTAGSDQSGTTTTTTESGSPSVSTPGHGHGHGYGYGHGHGHGSGSSDQSGTTTTTTESDSPSVSTTVANDQNSGSQSSGS